MVLSVTDDYLKSSKPKKVLITGFGPFGVFKLNPSWEAVEAVDTRNMRNGHKITMIKEQLAVRYVDVDLKIPKLLDITKPHLTIHVGVSSEVKCLRLEMKARKNGYNRLDNAYRKVGLGKHPLPGPDSIATSFIVKDIQKEYNETRSTDDLEVEVSDDAGLFLCEYIYYTSLSQGRCPTLFVHVPPGKKPEQLARGLERIVELCLKQL